MSDKKSISPNTLGDNDPALRLAMFTLSQCYQDGETLVCLPDGSYWEFTETHWRQTEPPAIRHQMLRIVTEDPSLLPAKRGVAPLISQSLICIQDILGIDEDVLNLKGAPHSVVNLKNGELWIEKDGSINLTPHSPKSGLTSCAPLEYSPNALCPMMDKTLMEIFSKANDPKGLVAFFWEIFGYAIQPLRNKPYFIIFNGNGANGKTQLLKTFQILIGDDAVLNESLDHFFNDNFGLSSLLGKMLLIDDDLKKGLVLNDGLLKKISEDKLISARRAYGKTKIQFKSRVLPIMASNSYPQTKDVSMGMRRRAIVVPFDYVIPEEIQDPNLFPTIWADELPGILNKAIKGYQRYVARGQKFDLPVDVIKAINEFFMQADPVNLLLSEVCDEKPDGKIKLMDLREAMKVTASEQGLKSAPFADNTLKRKLMEMGYKVSKINGYNTVHGLSLSGNIQ